MKKNKKLIPSGMYCYTIENGKPKRCPYWGIDDVHKYVNEYGYCSYLGKGDWDINEEQGVQTWTRGNDNSTFEIPAHEMPTSLLWDQCKECGINID